MPRFAALLFLAGVAVAAIPKRRAPRPSVVITDSVTLSDRDAAHLALLFCECPACMPSWSIH